MPSSIHEAMIPAVALCLLVMLPGAVVSAERCASNYGQCGGKQHTGPTCCVDGASCVYNSEWYSQCVPGVTNGNGGGQPLYYQCGGKDWKGPTTCAMGGQCMKQDEYYSQCVPTPTSEKLCIFDFDDTIKVGKGSKKTDVKPGRDAIAIIRKCKAMGYGVAIATASCETPFVKEFLNERVDGDIFDKEMLSSNRFQSCQPYKTPALRTILSEYDMSSFPECAVFFDDKDFNGKFSVEADINFIKVDPEYGVSWDDFWRGMKLLDKRCP